MKRYNQTLCKQNTYIHKQEAKGFMGKRETNPHPQEWGEFPHWTHKQPELITKVITTLLTLFLKNKSTNDHKKLYNQPQSTQWISTLSRRNSVVGLDISDISSFWPEDAFGLKALTMEWIKVPLDKFIDSHLENKGKKKLHWLV